MLIVGTPKAYIYTFVIGVFVGFGFGTHAKGAELPPRQCAPHERTETISGVCLLQGDHDVYLCGRNGCEVTSLFHSRRAFPSNLGR